MINIYVGNLSYESTEEELRGLFEQFGEVSSASIIMDRYSGRSKGFGFVEMPNNSDAENAISELDGTLVKGRNIKVNETRPRNERAPRRPRRY